MSEPPSLEPPIADYISSLAESFLEIASIWFIGSRANGAARADSDWDFLVFATPGVLAALRADDSFRRGDVDLLVVTDGDSFQSPWPRSDKPGEFKSGHLYPRPKFDEDFGMDFLSEGFRWRQITCGTCSYVGSRLRGGLNLLAFRVFP